MKKILVCISGASACELGFLLLKNLEKKAKIYTIISNNAKISFTKENPHIKIEKFHQAIIDKYELFDVEFLSNEDISACVASGSFGIDITFITPCSINTLAKISCGISDNLITRSAAVALKERKKLILGVREMPFSTISLEQMAKISDQNTIIAPPIIASYGAKNLEQMQQFIVGKWLDLAGIEHKLYKKWE